MPTTTAANKKLSHITLQDVPLIIGNEYELTYVEHGQKVIESVTFGDWDAMSDRFQFRGFNLSTLIVCGCDVLKVVPHTKPPLTYEAALKEQENTKLPLVSHAPTGDDDIDVMSYHVGDSDYSDKKIQPWDIWEAYNLNPWDADIIKRTLRDKSSDSRIMDYEKIIHVCKKRIAMLKN